MNNDKVNNLNGKTAYQIQDYLKFILLSSLELFYFFYQLP